MEKADFTNSTSSTVKETLKMESSKGKANM